MIKWKAWPCYKCSTMNRKLTCKGCKRAVLDHDRVAEGGEALQPANMGTAP